MIKILVAEDEANLRHLVCNYLRNEGYFPVEAQDGQQAVDKFYEDCFSLVLLDIMMPKMNGFEVCGEIRKNSDVPILMLTARNTEYDELSGFEYGADEYITKPFSPQILMSRIAAVLKRAGVFHKNEICVGNLKISYREHVVYDNGKRIKLTPREFDFICYLAENKGQVLTREQILQAVWGMDYEGDIRTVDTHVKCLRLKMPYANEHIKTVRKFGYILENAL